jgi:hypothetical protein
MAIVLVFAGTLAEVRAGLWEAQRQYFHALFVCWTLPGTTWRVPIWPGGYLLGWVLLVNLLAAHIVRFKLSRRKIGILLTHLGLILLLLGQFLTELFQVESSMRLEPGRSMSYSESTRHHQLALIDVSEPDRDSVVAISDSVLERKGNVRPTPLPFTVRVLEWYPNSNPQLVAPFQDPVTVDGRKGVGRILTFKPCQLARRMEEPNMPSAELEIVADDGHSERWMVSSFLASDRSKAAVIDWAKGESGMDLSGVINQPQRFTVRGRTYELALRPTRYYNLARGSTRPYTLTLLEFRNDLYPGTDMSKNFSSLVRLQNPETGEDRNVLIHMNHPLRYGGETFYQVSFDPTDDRVTILQVVRNPVWLTPYAACAMIASGLFIHFLIALLAFVKRRAAASPESEFIRRASTQPIDASGAESAPFPSDDTGLSASTQRWIKPGAAKWLSSRALIGGFALWVLLAFVPRTERTAFYTDAFGNLPILLNGRLQPMDSMARNALILISGINGSRQRRKGANGGD